MIDFEDVYRKHANDVYRFALWLCRNEAMADDITAETFARAWSGYDEIKATSVKSYLLTIARHLVWKWTARARREDSIGPDVPDGRPVADERLAASAELSMVLVALEKLPQVDQAALALRVEGELSYEEIARVLDITPGAAKVKVHRARLRLALAREAASQSDAKTEPNRTEDTGQPAAVAPGHFKER